MGLPKQINDERAAMPMSAFNRRSVRDKAERHATTPALLFYNPPVGRIPH